MLWLLIFLLIMMAFTLILAFIQISNLIALLRGKGVPYVPLSKKQMRHVDQYINFHEPDQVKFVDLGSGDGRILRLMEEKGVQDLTGYEVNWWAHLKSKFLARKNKSQAKHYLQNFHQVDLSKFNTVFCYLLGNALKGLVPKFEKELTPGTIIISYAFPIEGWRKPKKIIYTNNKKKNIGRIFLYQID